MYQIIYSSKKLFKNRIYPNTNKKIDIFLFKINFILKYDCLDWYDKYFLLLYFFISLTEEVINKL